MSQTGEELIGTIIFVCVAFAALGIFVLVLLFSYQRKYIKHIKTQEALKLDNERNLLNAQIEVREQTLKDAGQELHDNVGQLLSLAKMQLAGLKDDRTITTKELLQEAIEEVRNLSHRLNLDWAQDFDLLQLIQIEITKLTKLNTFDIDYQFTKEKFGLANNQKVVLIRCLQETVQNIIKHAEAKKIEIDITLDHEQLQLTIKDNGKGLDSSIKSQTAGLINMKARIKSAGGEFELESIKDKGTTCKFIVPLDKEENFSLA